MVAKPSAGVSQTKMIHFKEIDGTSSTNSLYKRIISRPLNFPKPEMINKEEFSYNLVNFFFRKKIFT